MSERIESSAAALAEAIRAAGRGLVGREALVETIALAAVAGEHVLVIGPPGTAKSEAARRFSRAIESSYLSISSAASRSRARSSGPSISAN